MTDRRVPTVVIGISHVTAIGAGAGANHSCASVGGGADAYCWGDNMGKQVVAIDWGLYVSPLATGVTSVSQIDGGTQHTCAVSSGGITCWGYNNYGQLGDGKSGLSLQTVLTSPPAAPTVVGVVPGVSMDVIYSCSVRATNGEGSSVASAPRLRLMRFTNIVPLLNLMLD